MLAEPVSLEVEELEDMAEPISFSKEFFEGFGAGLSAGLAVGGFLIAVATLT